ncbi:MAG: DNRLRE domain-containing protein [Minisyncoccota bacterium]
MRKLFAVLLLCTAFALPAHAVTVWYQPMPLPLAIPESANHIRDGWINNSFNQTFVQDDKLKIGGWGDVYRSYINMDLTGLPKDPTNVALWLRFYPSGVTTTPFRFCIPNSAWDTAMTWGTQPSFLGCTTSYYSPPTTDSWAGWGITSWYQNWQNGVWGKYGIMLSPQYNNNNFDFIRSSRYAGDGYRPILQLDFTPTLELKMPFNGLWWSVTTEIGGIGCSYIHNGHQGNGYFSIDFSGKAKDANGNVVYPDPSTANIPIIAAAAGTVINDTQVESTTAGYYVRIKHGTTGIATGYYHMKSPPLVHINDVIPQGKILGYMGNTPINLGMGVHLDFNVQYNGNGGSNQPNLSYVVMDGWILKSFQVDACTNGESGRYYRSSNVLVP